MKKAWPQFRLVSFTDYAACWEGPVTSWEKAYTIRIWYVPTGEIGGCLVPTCQPDVYLVSEKLHFFHWASGQLLPHVNPRRGRYSLCCFDASKGDWDPSRAIADTIVHYAANWLRFYELWCVTGKWSGPETARVTMDMLIEENPTSRLRSSQGRPAPGDRHGLSCRGPRTATSTSFALMEAGSRASFPPLSLLDWSNACQPEPALPITSTSSPALPLAA
jgi:hypothetical protein